MHVGRLLSFSLIRSFGGGQSNYGMVIGEDTTILLGSVLSHIRLLVTYKLNRLLQGSPTVVRVKLSDSDEISDILCFVIRGKILHSTDATYAAMLK